MGRFLMRTTVACCADLGERSQQQDRALAVIDGDGAWVIAVADGAGGQHDGARAAEAAISAVPARIGGMGHMRDVMADAARAVQQASLDQARSSATTLAVASWTPEDGLSVAWIGDSAPFLLPADSSGATVHGIIPAATGRLSNAGAAGRVCSLLDDIPLDRYRAAYGDRGGAVVLCSDGAYSPLAYTAWERGGWLNNTWLSNALPPAERADAASVANGILEAARNAGLSDNASVAAAVFSETPEMAQRWDAEM